MKFRKRFAAFILALTMAFGIPAKTEAFPALAPIATEVVTTATPYIIAGIVAIAGTIYEVSQVPRLPMNHKPNSILEKVNKSGKVIQKRVYDEKGRAKVDYDLTDHGFPDNHPNPHKHVFEGIYRSKAKPLSAYDYSFIDNH